MEESHSDDEENETPLFLNALKRTKNEEVWKSTYLNQGDQNHPNFSTSAGQQLFSFGENIAWATASAPKEKKSQKLDAGLSDNDGLGSSEQPNHRFGGSTSNIGFLKADCKNNAFGKNNCGSSLLSPSSSSSLSSSSSSSSVLSAAAEAASSLNNEENIYCSNNVNDQKLSEVSVDSKITGGQSGGPICDQNLSDSHLRKKVQMERNRSGASEHSTSGPIGPTGFCFTPALSETKAMQHMYETQLASQRVQFETILR